VQGETSFGGNAVGAAKTSKGAPFTAKNPYYWGMPAEMLQLPRTLSPEAVMEISAKAKAVLGAGDLHLDCSAVERLDTLGTALLADLRREAAAAGRTLRLAGLAEGPAAALARANEGTPDQSPAPPGFLESLGAGAWSLWREWKVVALLFSEALYHSTAGWRKPKTVLRGEAVRQMIRLGSTALPIVLLLSVLIGFTLALQSGLQLEKYGAAIFLADGIGISMITEIGPLMTAVILAGRSGSAITAELATMTVQEEVSALRAMAANPVQFLVLPRFWALTAAQPLLTVASALSGIFSGLVVALLFFNISPQAFLNQLQGAVDVKYVGQMLVKSVTFAWLIVLIASVKGLGVRGGADAVGRATTECVVACIFAIVLADALFSFIFYV
jgi:phospholipid/cholesterol/gamma-HCH transport system permease protein